MQTQLLNREHHPIASILVIHTLEHNSWDLHIPALNTVGILQKAYRVVDMCKLINKELALLNAPIN